MLAETAQDIIVMHDLNGDLIYVNQAGLKSTGFTPEGIREKNIRDMIPGNQLETIYDRLFRRIKGENSVSLFETEFIDYRQQSIPVEISSSLIKTNGKSSHVLLVMRDISERKRVQSEMNILAHAIKSIGESVSVTDMEDQILFVNDAFLATYGYSREELTGKHIGMVRSGIIPWNWCHGYCRPPWKAAGRGNCSIVERMVRNFIFTYQPLSCAMKMDTYSADRGWPGRFRADRSGRAVSSGSKDGSHWPSGGGSGPRSSTTC